METLFDDEFVNNKVLERLIKEVRETQMTRTLKSIDYYNEIRKKLNRKYDFLPSQNDDLKVLIRDKYYAKKSLQA